MEQYRVIIAPGAENDIREIAENIRWNLHQPDTAAKLLARIYKEIFSLETMPERYAISRNPDYARQGYRVTSVGNYLLFYTVDKPKKAVHVLGVQHGSRNWRKIL